MFPAGPVARLEGADASGSRFRVTVGDVTGLASAEIIGEEGLQRGVVLDDAGAARLTDACRQLAVFDRAVGLLAMRPKTRRELATSLRRRGASAADVEVAATRLTELGILDDARYAQAHAAARSAQGESRRMAAKRLKQKGVAGSIAESAVREAYPEDEGEELAAAVALVERRIRSMSKLDAATIKRRLYGFLARRGYGPAICAAALRAVAKGASRTED